MTYTEPISYWQSTLDAPPLVADPLPATADVVVVGGGVLGTVTALWLARAGAKPLLLERASLAAGASGRNGGLIVPGTAEAYPDACARHGHAAARAVWALTVQGLAQLDMLLAEEAIACNHRRIGSVNLALTAAQRAHHAHTVEQLQADGFSAELLDREQLQELIATPLGPEILGGKLLPEGRAVHSAHLVRGLAEAARRHGARLCTGVAVTAIIAEGTGLRIETSQGSLGAGAAVVALNGWSTQLLPQLAGLIRPVRGQVLAYRPLPPVFHCSLGASCTPTGEYWQQTPDGSLVVGGCRALAPDGDVDRTDVSTSAEVQAGIEAVLPRLFPELQGLHVERRWGGTMGFSPDYLPLAGRLGALPLWYAGGFSGHGMPFAVPLGQLLAEAAMGGTTPAGLEVFGSQRLRAAA